VSELPDNIPPEYLDYIEDELSPAQAMAFEAKLAADPVLRDSLDALRVDRMLLRELPQVSAPASLTQRLEQVIQRQSSPWRTYRPAIAAGLALCCVGLGVLMVANFWPAHPSGDDLALNTGKPAVLPSDLPTDVHSDGSRATTKKPTAKDSELALLDHKNEPIARATGEVEGGRTGWANGDAGRGDRDGKIQDSLALAPSAPRSTGTYGNKELLLPRSATSEIASLHKGMTPSPRDGIAPTTVAPTPVAPVVTPSTSTIPQPALAVTQPTESNTMLALVIQVHNDQQEQTALQALQQVQNSQLKNWRIETEREKLAAAPAGGDATKFETAKKLRKNEDTADLRLDSSQMETLVATLPDTIGLFVDTPMPEIMDKAGKVSGTGANLANKVAVEETDLNGSKQVGQQILGNTSQPQRMRINLRGVVLEQQGGNLSQQFQRNQQNLNGYFDNPRLTNGMTAPRWLVRIERVAPVTDAAAERINTPAKP
jgi:hypothetical protein